MSEWKAPLRMHSLLLNLLLWCCLALRGPVVRGFAHEIVAPHVVAILGPQPHTRTGIPPQAPALGLPRWHFQPFPAPEPLHPLMVDLPPFFSEEGRDAAVAVAPIAGGEGDHA